jgi:hypothetical protein
MTGSNKLYITASSYVLIGAFLLLIVAKALNLFEYISEERYTSKEEWTFIKVIIGILLILIIGIYFFISSSRASEYSRLIVIRKLSNVPNFNYKKATKFQNSKNQVIAIDTLTSVFCIAYSVSEIYYLHLNEVERCQIVVNEKVHKELVSNTTTLSGSAQSHLQDLGRVGGAISNTEHSVKEIEHIETEHMYLKIFTNKIEFPILCYNFGITDRENNINEMETWQRRFELFLKNNHK